MRGVTAGLVSPRPLVETLPAMFQDDPMVCAWLDALDEVLAPVFLTLDGFPAYLDPWLTPADFVPWLAGWVGLALDPAWPMGRRRAAIAQAAELYRWRGTAVGVAAAVELATGVSPEVTESGGATWSARPTAGPTTGPGPPADPGAAPYLLVRLRVPAGAAPDLNAARRAVDLSAPAHVPTTVEIVPDAARLGS
jgi:phage tail-like protein